MKQQCRSSYGHGRRFMVPRFAVVPHVCSSRDWMHLSLLAWDGGLVRKKAELPDLVEDVAASQRLSA